MAKILRPNNNNSNTDSNSVSTTSISDLSAVIAAHQSTIDKLYGRITIYDPSYISNNHKTTLTPAKIREKILKLEKNIARTELIISKIKVYIKYCRKQQKQIRSETDSSKSPPPLAERQHSLY